MVPDSYKERVLLLSHAVGHVGLRLLEPSRAANDLNALKVLETVVWPTAQRATSLKLVCPQKESARVKEIFSGHSRHALDIARACSPDFLDVWTGRAFSRDSTIAIELALGDLRDAPILSAGTDPFVMENLRSFLGGAGAKLTVPPPPEADPTKIVVAFVGGISDVFFFADQTLMPAVVSAAYERCGISSGYLRAVAGPLVPIEEVLALIAKRQQTGKNVQKN